jgi:hypothetical protein
MREKLIEINELMELLGFEDGRTIENWCKKNKLPILKMGKKKYTVSSFLELFITDELTKFVSAKYENPEKIMDALQEDDKTEFAELVKAPVSKKSVDNYKSKTNSKAAQDYINKFKAA